MEFLSLKEAIKKAEASEEVKAWKEESGGYLYSAHINTSGPVDHWELNYYCPATKEATTFDVNEGIRDRGASPLLGGAVDPRPLDLKKAKPVSEAYKVAYQELGDFRYEKILLVVQLPHNKRHPILIANFIAGDMDLLSIRVDLISKRIISQRKENLLGAIRVEKVQKNT